MFKPTVSRRGIARTLSTLLALALTVGVGGLSANGASATAAAETPQHVTAVSTSQADDTGNVVVNWTALGDPGSVSNVDVELDGQGLQQIPSDNTAGATFYGVAPGPHTASVAFVYSDSSPTSGDVTAGVTVEHVAAPTAVSDVHGTSNGTHVTVSWTSAVDQDPEAPGAPYDHYDVTLEGQPAVTVQAGFSDTSFTGIVPGTYNLTVAAVNTGHATEATGSIVVTGATVPDAPLSVTARNTANTTIGVVWEAPLNDGGNAITDYEVVLSYPDGNDGFGGFPEFTAADPPSGDKRDAGFAEMPLDQGDYVVTVRAINASGAGPTASTPKQPMVPSTVPDAPTEVSAISPEGNTAVVSWTAPVVDGGQPIDAYDVTLGDDTLYTDGAGRDLMFGDVAAGTYDVAVTAHNSNGDSVAGTTTVTIEDASTPPPGPGPGVATHLHATKVKKGGVTTIKWTAPKVGDGMPVALYVLLVDGRITFAPGDKTKLKVKGLRAGPAKIKLIALNENGFSKIAKIKIHVAKAVAQAPKETLRLGMNGPAVKRLQKHMGMRHPSGIFGKSTRHRVLQYQRWTGKKKTGEVNDRMRYLLDV